MRRAAIERSRAHRVWKAHIRFIHNGEFNTGCICDTQVNRFRKGQRQLGCGKPRCYICHGPKLLGEPTKADRMNRERAKSSWLDYANE